MLISVPGFLKVLYQNPKNGNQCCFSHEEVLGAITSPKVERLKLHPASPIDCPAHCQLERGLLNRTQLTDQLMLVTNSTRGGKNDSTVQLTVGGEKFEEFCLTRACSHDGEQWHFHYQACGR